MPWSAAPTTSGSAFEVTADSRLSPASSANPADRRCVGRKEDVEMTSILGFHGIRYQTKDVRRAVDFYTGHLGFKLEHQHLPEFATVSLDDVHLLLSGPGASGSRPMSDGRRQ